MGADSAGDFSASPEPTAPTVAVPPEAGGARDAGVSADAAEKATIGSPLCKRAAADCKPDDAYAASCANDAGEPLSCRVSRTLGDGPFCSSSGKGQDGDLCASPSECAAGFDCIDASNGERRCRHYCCESPCTAVGAANAKMYCGIGTAMGTKIPVCMPVKPCTLMAQGACPAGETCGVVRDDGTTSCIQTGPQRAGEACDRENCAAGLTCIGASGSQKCYKLCREGTTEDCGVGERCVGGPPLFKDGGFGLCVGNSGSGKMP